jgi:hypothetical protein
VQNKLELTEKFESGASGAHVYEKYGAKKQAVSDAKRQATKLFHCAMQMLQIGQENV